MTEDITFMTSICNLKGYKQKMIYEMMLFMQEFQQETKKMI